MSSSPISTEKTSTSPASGPLADWGDWIGMVASIGCAIHCAAMPFVIAFLPALGLSFLADEAFHQWMAIICFTIALAAFVPGFRRHRRILPAAIGSVGLTLISVAAFGMAGECCPSCAAGSVDETPAIQEVSLETSDSAAIGGIVSESDTCDCEFCDAAAVAEQEEPSLPPSLAATAPTQSASFLSRIAVWLTPVGGLILVSAHLLNRRYGCLCGCCETGDEQPSVTSTEAA